jgi:hypothetical protein
MVAFLPRRWRQSNDAKDIFTSKKAIAAVTLVRSLGFRISSDSNQAYSLKASFHSGIPDRIGLASEAALHGFPPIRSAILSPVRVIGHLDQIPVRIAKIDRLHLPEGSGTWDWTFLNRNPLLVEVCDDLRQRRRGDETQCRLIFCWPKARAFRPAPKVTVSMPRTLL